MRPTANHLYSKIVLASASPQRKALLNEYGFDFIVCPSHVPEPIDELISPEENAQNIATMKAQSVQKKFPEGIILAADTMVVRTDGVILGKPTGREDAREMLLKKKNTTEQVITGFCIAWENVLVQDFEISSVTYQDFSPEVVDAILETNEWENVAGALRIEGVSMQQILQNTTGDYHNIIGLPVGKIAYLLRDFPV